MSLILNWIIIIIHTKYYLDDLTQDQWGTGIAMIYLHNACSRMKVHMSIYVYI